MFNNLQLPFKREAEKHSEDTNTLPRSEWIFMCAQCGEKKSDLERTEEDVFIWNKLLFSKIPVGSYCICTKCSLHFLKFKVAFEDCADLITCSNYISRAITCRKHYLKTSEKSKQQVSLDKCLSTRQKEFLTETWI